MNPTAATARVEMTVTARMTAAAMTAGLGGAEAEALAAVAKYVVFRLSTCIF